MIKHLNHKTRDFSEKQACIKGNSCSIGKKLDILLKKLGAANCSKGKKGFQVM